MRKPGPAWFENNCFSLSQQNILKEIASRQRSHQGPSVRHDFMLGFQGIAVRLFVKTSEIFKSVPRRTTRILSTCFPDLLS